MLMDLRTLFENPLKILAELGRGQRALTLYTTISPDQRTDPPQLQ